MKRLIISNEIKTNLAVTAEKAEYIKKLIVESIKNKESILLDFSDITSLTTAFLNKAVGELYDVAEPEELNRLVRFDQKTITSLQATRIRDVMTNTKEKQEEEYQKMVDEVTMNG